MSQTPNQYAMQDPIKQYPQPKFEDQPQSAPGLARDMVPKPDHGEVSYRGFGRLMGRHAIITGADSGIGRAVAIAFAREGADIVLNYLPTEEQDAQEVVTLIEAAGRKAVAIPGDISDEAFCSALVEHGREALGGLDILVNVAGKQVAVKEIADLSTEQFDATFRTNVYAMFWLCKAALPHMPRGATIVNTTSIQSYQPSPSLLDYASTKAAITAFTHALAKQVAQQGIRVNAVAPGPVWTPLQPSGGQPEEKIPEFGLEVPMQRPGQPAELASVYVLLALAGIELHHRRNLRRDRRQPPAVSESGLRRDGFLPLDRYAAIGDGRSVALVGADGSIDWWCVPNMDSEPLFDRLLDPAAGGRFSVTPVEPFTVERRYRPDSNVLEQVFTTASGTARLTDSLNSGISGRLPWSELARRVDGLTGTVAWRIEALIGDRLGRSTPWREPSPHGDVLHVDAIVVALRSDGEVERTQELDRGVVARLATRPGSRATIAMLVAQDEPLILPSIAEIDARIDRSDQAWREWCGNLKVSGPYAAELRRSALALKLLLFSPTGAIAAAATTSLPERIGGDKNYDYRFAWVRDVAYTIKAFLRVGAIEEATAAFGWLTATIRRHGGSMATMYRLDGSEAPAERARAVPGYRGSVPVLDGNRAGTQLQLGIFGDCWRRRRCSCSRATCSTSPPAGCWPVRRIGAPICGAARTAASGSWNRPSTTPCRRWAAGPASTARRRWRRWARSTPAMPNAGGANAIGSATGSMPSAGLPPSSRTRCIRAPSAWMPPSCWRPGWASRVATAWRSPATPSGANCAAGRWSTAIPAWSWKKAPSPPAASGWWRRMPCWASTPRRCARWMPCSRPAAAISG